MAAGTPWDEMRDGGGVLAGCTVLLHALRLVFCWIFLGRPLHICWSADGYVEMEVKDWVTVVPVDRHNILTACWRF